MTDECERYRSSPDLAEALQSFVAGDRDALDGLTPDQRAIADDLAPRLAVLAEQGPREPDRDHLARELAAASSPRDLADDPVAIALGLVPDHARPLSVRAFTRARKASGLSPSAVLSALTARGWDITLRDVVRWERVDTPLPPALTTALAETLDVAPYSLTLARSPGGPEWLLGMLDDHRVAEVMRAWAADLGVDLERARERFVDALVGAGYRQQRAPTTEALLAVLKVLRDLDQPPRRR